MGGKYWNESKGNTVRRLRTGTDGGLL